MQATRRGILGIFGLAPFAAREAATVAGQRLSGVALLGATREAQWGDLEHYGRETESVASEDKAKFAPGYAEAIEKVRAAMRRRHDNLFKVNGIDYDLVMLRSVSPAWIIAQQKKRNAQWRRHYDMLSNLEDELFANRCDLTMMVSLISKVTKLLS